MGKTKNTKTTKTTKTTGGNTMNTKSTKSTKAKNTKTTKTADAPKLTGQALVMHHIEQQQATTQAIMTAYAKSHKGTQPRGMAKSFTNPVTGKDFRDDNVAILAWHNYANGYKSTKYATKRQIEVNHGTIDADAVPATMYCPFGKSSKMMYWEVYSFDTVTWEGGEEPTEWVKPSKSKATKTAKTKTSKTKTSKTKDAKTDANDGTVTMTPDQLQAVIAQAVAAAMQSIA